MLKAMEIKSYSWREGGMRSGGVGKHERGSWIVLKPAGGPEYTSGSGS